MEEQLAVFVALFGAFAVVVTIAFCCTWWAIGSNFSTLDGYDDDRLNEAEHLQIDVRELREAIAVLSTRISEETKDRHAFQDRLQDAING